MKSAKMSRAKISLIVIVSILLAISMIIVGVEIWKNSKLEELQNSALNELIERTGEYDESSIVLYDTSYGEANALAEKFSAKLRITDDGKFATLTLPEGVTIVDIYSNDDNKEYIPSMSADWQVSASELAEGQKLPSRPSVNHTDTYYGNQKYPWRGR